MPTDKEKSYPKTLTVKHSNEDSMIQIHDTIERYIAKERLDSGRVITKPEAAAELLLKYAAN